MKDFQQSSSNSQIDVEIRIIYFLFRSRKKIAKCALQLVDGYLLLIEKLTSDATSWQVLLALIYLVGGTRSSFSFIQYRESAMMEH